MWHALRARQGVHTLSRTMTTLHPLAAALLLAAATLAAGCAPSVVAPDPGGESADHATIEEEGAGAPSPPSRPLSSTPASLPCLCPAPQVCDGAAGACLCPDAPERVEADCAPGERIALCGDTMPPPCRRAHSANAEHVACCVD